MMQKLWKIYDPANGVTGLSRATLQEAQQDATKEARLSGRPIYVLETIGVVEPVETPVEWREL